MKNIFKNKTFLLSACFILIIALCSGLFYAEYSSVLEEKDRHASSLHEANKDKNILLSQNSDLQHINDKLNSANDALSSTVSKLTSDVTALNSQLSSTEAELNEINSNTVTSNSVSGSGNNIKIDTSNLTAPNVGSKVCYLTFDDGPSDNTLKILETLKKANAKATFFVKGNSNMNYLRNIDDAGHAVGLHTNSHVYENIYKSVSNYYKDLEAIKAKVKDRIGKDVNIIRFPGGSSNTTSKKTCRGIMTTLTKDKTKSVVAKGYKYFDWNVDSGDALKNGVPVNTLINNIIKGSKGRGDICVLMHDTGAKSTTVQALPQIICYLRSQGYRFEALTTESPGFHHGVNN